MIGTKKGKGDYTLEDWENAPLDPFNCEEHFNKVLRPQLEALSDQMKALGIPHYLTVTTKQERDGATHHVISDMSHIDRIAPEMLAHVLVEELPSPLVFLQLNVMLDCARVRYRRIHERTKGVADG